MESIDILLAKATNPIATESEVNAIVEELATVVSVNSESSQLVLRLLAHKIQSPQEIEALRAIDVLELLVPLEPRLIAEIGKFRFLNELIKVVSPKYLANRSPVKVKDKIVDLLFLWSVEIKEEPKIFEAYQMLKKQGIITNDPVHLLQDRKPPTPPPPRPKDEIFDDEEKSKQLKKLLQSRDPDDIQAANRLIRSMALEADKRIDLKIRCNLELESVRNNVKVLSDMLTLYKPHETSGEELELINELFGTCEILRPKLFRLAAEMGEKDPQLSDILDSNDELTRVINQYKAALGLCKDFNTDVNNAQANSLLDIMSPTQEAFDVALLCDGANSEFQHQIANRNEVTESTKSTFDVLGEIFCTKSDAVDTLATANPLIPECMKPVHSGTNSSQNVHNSSTSAFEELELLSKALMKQSITSEKRFDFPNASKTPLNQMQKLQTIQSYQTTVVRSASPTSTISSNSSTSSPSKSNQPESNDNASSNCLKDLFVPLETIRPGPLQPITLLEKSGIKVVLFFGQDSPKTNVTVTVVTIMSTNENHVSKVTFLAAVPKSMRVKLQPPSASSLPPYSPFIPPAAITQVMLISSNRTESDEKLRLKFKLSCVINDELRTETGELEDLFEAVSS